MLFMLTLQYRDFVVQNVGCTISMTCFQMSTGANFYTFEIYRNYRELYDVSTNVKENNDFMRYNLILK